MSAPDRANDPSRKYNPPKLGDIYTTHKSNVTGKVEEIVANPSGSSRIRLSIKDAPDRWTTHIPPKED